MKSYDERYDVGRQTERYSPREPGLRPGDDYASGRSDWNRDRRDYDLSHQTLLTVNSVRLSG